jgi:hypothetical protein
MRENFGTVCLITDPQSDAYLMKHSLQKNEKKVKQPEDTLSRWCGGKGGFDLYTERLYE